MSVRNRHTETTSHSGYNGRFGSYSDWGYKVNYLKDTTDEVAIYDNAQFSSSYKLREGGRLNRPYTDWANVWWQDFLADAFRYDNIASMGHLGLSGVPPLTDLAVKAAARTSPSRPYIDVPVEALQLGDLLRAAYHFGEPIVRQIAKGNLHLQFNVLPIIEDVKKILDFSDQVERRIKELERLRGPKGLRRTIPLGGLGEFSADSTWSQAVQTQDAYIVVGAKGHTVQQFGAHVRWKPTMDLSYLQPGRMRLLARNAVLGETFDLASIWQLIPWTWLIDWCVSIGDYFKANRNIIPAELDSLTITRHTRSEYNWDGTGGPNLGGYGAAWSLTAARYVREDKERIPVSLIPTAHFPFLSGNQLGILGSLAIAGKSYPLR